MTAPQQQRVVTPEEFQEFIHVNLGNALRLIQEAQTAIDQMVIHLTNQGATAHLPTKEEVLAKRRAEVFNASPKSVSLGVKGNVGPGPHPRGLPGPTREAEPTFAVAALAEPDLTAETEDKRETVIQTIMKVMGRTRDEAEALIESAKDGKLNSAKKHAAEMLVPTDDWLPLFQGRTSIFAEFLGGEIYEFGRGPVVPRFVSGTGYEFEQYGDDLTQNTREEGFFEWPTGFYRSSNPATQEGHNNLQFKLNLDNGDVIILEDMYSMPSLVEPVGPYALVPQRVTTLPFPVLRELYDRIQTALWKLLK